MEEQAVETTIYSLATSAPTQPERRGGDRYLSLLRVGAIMVEGRRELCLIRNISAGGMMIRAYSNIAVGTRLSVELKQGDPVKGVVKWVDNGMTGVTFDAPIDVVLLLAPPGDGPRPRLPRIEVDCTAWVREDGNVIRTRVLNISQGGLCVEARAPLTIGANVVTTLPGLAPAPGVVKWNEDGVYGLSFNRSLVLSDLVTWLQELQQGERRRVSA
ncbi:MAG TPA: PilZ domain-containing protein [Sphingomicrobium sp.]|nr:PilZ domain-containing protein [Sphingomicrobium sp.]